MLSDWKLGETLAHGTFSTVHVATHAETGTQAVAKCLRARYRRQTKVRAQFLREAHLLQALHAPQFPRVLALDDDEERAPCMVLSFEPHAETLSEHLRARRALRPTQALRVTLCIANACDALHQQGLVHCDLKPANIVLCRSEEKDFEIKLIDLGSALKEGERPSAPAAGGSAAFMSPEHARGRALDRRSDIYSLGALLFLMLSGENLYGSNQSKKIILQLRKATPQNRIAKSALPEALRALILKTCAEAARERFASIRELSDAINLVLLDCAH